MPRNQNIKILYSLLLVIAVNQCPMTRLFGQDPLPFEIRNFTRADYGTENQNWAIARDQQGTVYAANNIGLTEFDGVVWKYHPSPHGTVIRSVAVDDQGRIFASGYRELGYWERNRVGELEYFSLNSLAESRFARNEEFWNTVIIGDRVYFHSFSSLFIFQEDHFNVVRPGNLINSISEVNGDLIMHIQGEGLFRLNDSIAEPYLTEPELKGDIVHFCIPDTSGGILIGTASSGMYMYRDGALQPYLEQWRPYFSENKINRGILLGDRQLVIGTLLDGVLVFDLQGRLLHHIHIDNGLQNNTVLGICSGGPGNLWLALDKGVDFLSFERDPSYSFIPCEGVGAVYSAVRFSDELYLCTNQGVFYRNWQNQRGAFEMVPGTQGQAWSANVYDDELIVNHNDGTFRIEHHEAEKISPVAGGFSLIRNPLHENELIQSTYSNIVIFGKQDGRWQYQNQLPGFIDLIRYIELDHLNNLWASHMHRAVFRLRLGDDQRTIKGLDYYGDSIFGKDFDIQVFKVEGRIVFTTGEKIYTYDDITDHLVPFGAFNSQLGNHARAHRIIHAADHHYWFIGNEMIGLFHIADGVVEKIREFPTELFRDHLIAGYENIYPLDTLNGLLCLDNGLVELKADVPDLSGRIEQKVPILRAITISGKTGSGRKIPLDLKYFRIPFRRNSITLGFGFPPYSTETSFFQSFVEGLDESWSEPQAQPVFHFTRMPAGEYRIRVRAYNGWNKYSKAAEVSFLVQRPWYLSVVSMIVYGLFLLGVLLWGRKLLLRRIRIREEKIHEAKERELIRLRNEKLNAELSHKSQELANSTMAMIKKNEFLMELKENLKRQKEELGSRYPDKYFHAILRKIDGNISSMDDWQVFEFHFEKAHEKFLQKLMTKYPQLSHSDLRLCAYLRMNLSSKEIAPLLRISYRGVENHRYRLRKKLHLKKDVNLTDFILSI